MAKTNLQIFIDSCGELNKEMRTKYDIDYTPMMLNIEGKEIPASLDFDAGYSILDMSNIMKSGKRIFTAQVPIPTFEEKFKAALDAGKDVLYISCSSGLSASVKSAEQVAAELLKAYPDRKIVCFDSLHSGYSQAGMAIKAAEMRDEGKSLEEIHEWLKANVYKFNMFATVEDLKFLKVAGRVTAGSAFFGNLFHVHPVLIADKAGHNNAIKKVNGTKGVLSYLVRAAVDAAENIEEQTVYLAGFDADASVEFMKNELLKLAKPKEVYVGNLGPILGASTGPGTVAIFVYGKEVCLEIEA